MKRWNIRKLVIYSHDNKRSDLDFDLEAVNIITGDSQTGKSTIPEIIDYVMGSSECNIPAFARDSLSWVGLLWVRNETEILMIRQVPRRSQNAASRYYLDYGQNLSIPNGQNEIQRTEPLEAALSMFERQLGLGNAMTETFGAITRQRHKVSIRHAMPFLLVMEDVIINKNVLLKGTNDPKRRQAILDAIPYFLGVVDESTLEQELRLRDQKRQLTRLEKSLNEVQSDRNKGHTMLQSLLSQAVSLGMVEISSSALTQMDWQAGLPVLANLSRWGEDELPFVRDDRRRELEAELEQMQVKAFRLRTSLRAAKHSVNARDSYEGILQKQRNRLEVVRLFKRPGETSSCPLCEHELAEMNPPLRAIKHHIELMEAELKSVDKGRPKLDGHIREQSEELSGLQEQIDGVKQQIRALNQVEDDITRRNNITRARLKLALRAELHLESNQQSSLNNTDALLGKIEELRKSIEEQEELLDNRSKEVAFDNAQHIIASEAKEILGQLPFEPRYKGRPLFLNLTEAAVGVRTPQRNEPMKQLGSDENYLSLHVAVSLALHRFFSENDRPVPGVLVFDQLSRPYFPPDQTDVVRLESRDDRRSLTSYFDTLFLEVARGESLQVIVLEHAYFEDDVRFVLATKRQWEKNVEGLIPQHWPVTS